VHAAAPHPARAYMRLSGSSSSSGGGGGGFHSVLTSSVLLPLPHAPLAHQTMQPATCRFSKLKFVESDACNDHLNQRLSALLELSRSALSPTEFVSPLSVSLHQFCLLAHARCTLHYCMLFSCCRRCTLDAISPTSGRQLVAKYMSGGT